ncbi:hypothetical protein [Actinomadura gamaensis]|uniref:Helix-turn-helix domain-containing protein n=1 Tax=Actinomadura gamaensis TaxID=1763541 RepID=A0ABV9UC40_9ACTN
MFATVLPPVGVLARRADVVEVIGAAVEVSAAGKGHRRIAAGLGRPAETARGWLRRFSSRAERIRAAFTTLLAGFLADRMFSPQPPGHHSEPRSRR